MHETKPDRSDALVFFGATGDLAYKKIFPALQTLVQRGRLTVPVVGVAKSGWTRPQLVERARASIQEQGQFDAAAFARLEALLRYVDGDYNDAATFDQLNPRAGRRAAAGPLPGHPAQHVPGGGRAPAPPALDRERARGAGEAVRRDLASAKALNETLHRVFPERSIFRIDHYLGKEAVQNILYFRFANAFLDMGSSQRDNGGVQ